MATLVGLIEAAGAGYLIARLVDEEGTVALVAATVLAFPLLWGLWILSAAVPDLFTTRAITGTVLRCRTRTRVLSSGSSPKYWYYFAIDDGTRDRIAAFRVSEDRYRSVRQGQTVTADVTPRLGYVRAHQMRRSSFLKILRGWISSIWAAIWWKTPAASESGSVTTIGAPVSPPSRSSVTSGT